MSAEPNSSTDPGQGLAGRGGLPRLLPVRMLNEHVYCPRLFALEYLQQEWADSADTVEGRTVHRRVDQEGGRLPEPAGGEEPPAVARSVLLSDEGLGLIARIDLVESEGGRVVPVDYKRGSPPDRPERAWDPERVQVCAQGLLLRAHGYTCDGGVLYFAEARRRVPIPFTEELIALTRRHVAEAQALVGSGQLPAPLVDSPRCPRCSLVGICLPDEVNLLQGRSQEVRPLTPARDDGVPLYVRLQGGSLSKDHEEIVVRDKGAPAGTARLEDTTQIVVLGNVSVSTPLLTELAKREIPVSFHGYGGWYNGSFLPAGGHGVQARIAQHRTAGDAAAALALARSMVHGKIRNCRVLLQRNARGTPADALRALSELAQDAQRAPDVEVLMGVEGAAARVYFEQFTGMLKAEGAPTFDMNGRNRRPPRDPINALLSFAYACLARECTHVLHRVGLDPYVGFLHQPRPGRPALALDLMEEFRPIVADSAVITAINTGAVGPDDFVVRSVGVALSDAGRRRFIETYERRLDELATHPLFSTRMSMRRMVEMQARLLVRTLLGELDRYPEYRIR